MKKHTNEFKNKVKSLGRELDSIITYTINEENKILMIDDLNSVTPVFQGDILKSVMKELDIDSNIDIPIGTILNYKFGVKIDEETYEYLNFGNYIVYSSEKKEDTNSFQIICYDKLLYSMKNNEDLGISYPITIKEYIKALCDKLDYTFSSYSEEFPNYNRIIEKELYLGLNYTYRNILDELAQVTASTICLNENDELELRYINDTQDVITEEFLKDNNVNFGEKYGPINSIVLSRSAESDNVYLRDEESVEQNGLCELKIKDNQIMNWNDRSDYLPEILAQLNGLEYYINDYDTKGICYFDLCDRYTVSIGENQYNCILLNDEINVTQGLEELIYTDMPETSITDYTKADKDDRVLDQVYIIADKQNKQIEALVSKTDETSARLTKYYQDVNEFMLSVKKTGTNNLLKNSVMFAYNDGVPSDWEVSENGELSISSNTESISAGCVSGHSFTLKEKTVKQRVYVKADSEHELDKVYYSFSTKIKKDVTGTCYVKIYNTNEEYKIELPIGQSSFYGSYEIKALLPTDNYYDIEFYGSEDSNATFTDNMFSMGEYAITWSQASGEIMNTQVNINLDGVLVKSSIYQGDYTIMSPLEFAGYSNINGIITKVFSLNKDTTQVKKLKAEDEITMDPIKIVPITEGEIQGWAFVPSAGGGNK